MLSQLDYRIFGLETIKEQYANDVEFKDVMEHCKEGHTWNKYMLHDGFLFRAPMHSSWLSSSFVVVGGAWWQIDGIFWCQEDKRGVVHTLLLA